MHTPTLTKAFPAGAAVAGRRIVAFDGAGAVIQAAAATDPMFGVSERLGAAASGDNLDVHVTGSADVTYGGAVSQGDFLTSDADGKAVAAAPGAGTNNRIIGIALVDGILDDIGSALLFPSQIQG